MKKIWQKSLHFIIAITLGVYGLILNINAAETGLPWEGPLEKILASLTGPVAKVLGVIAIVLAGFGIAFGESDGTMRRIFQIVLGLSIAFTASSLVVSLFGFSGGVTF
ncbi:MAG: TrbC/VirB2 family protein [Coxiellaceae bacterium]|jgi:type IV secretion system protein VirB2|nr:TrbC/VirB2 family protein [Coxiellaceae bacterium]